jgi:hypothetical protein
MNVGAPELLIILILIFPAMFGIWLWGIIDAATRPDSQWAAASQNKVAWILLQVFLGIIGAAVYLLAIRPKLMAVGPQ